MVTLLSLWVLAHDLGLGLAWPWSILILKIIGLLVIVTPERYVRILLQSLILYLNPLFLSLSRLYRR